MITYNLQIITFATLLLLVNQVLAAKCKKDDDCTSSNAWNVCEVDTGKCIHKGVFPGLGMEIGGIFVLIALKILCTMAGVGGGGIVTPLCMVFFGFLTKDAVAVSAFATFAATFGSFITSFRNRHPEKQGVVLLDYGLTCIMMPTTLAGAQIGALVLVVFPAPLIQIFLTLMLICLGLQSLRKGLQIRKKEDAVIRLAEEKKKAEQELGEKGEATGTGSKNDKIDGTTEVSDGLEIVKYKGPTELKELKEQEPPLELKDVHDDSGHVSVQQVAPEHPVPTERAFQVTPDKSAQTAQPALKEVKAGRYKFIIGENDETDKDLKKLVRTVKLEESHCQWWKWLINVSLITYLILMNLALPTSTRVSPIGIPNCGAQYWILYVSFLVFCAITLAITIKLLKDEQELKVKYGNINIVASDIIFTKTNILKLVCLGFFGGLLAGAFGLGGGVIFNPILLTMGLPPQVAGANSLYLVCFSKIASCLVYILNGKMNILYALWVGLFTSLGGVLGSLFLILYVKYGGRQSTIVFILVAEFCISVALIPTFGALQVKQDYDAGKNIWQFSGVC